MFDKRFFWFIPVVIMTIGYPLCMPDVFLNGMEVDYFKIIYTVLLSAFICGAIALDGKKISKSIKAAASGIMLLLTPLFIIAIVMNNIHIAMLRLWCMNYLLIFVVLTAFVAISSRCSVSIIAVTIISFIIFVLNTEVTLFRGTPIVPADIFAVNTALSVSDNYKPVLTYEIFVSFQATVLWCMLATKLNFKLKGNIKGNIAIGIVAICLGILIFNGFERYFERNNPDKLYFDKYDTALSNKRFGTYLTYWLNAERMVIKKPLGYSKKAAEDILAQISETKTNSDVRPNVVVIMDEAFSDLTGVYDIAADREVLPNFKALKENTVRGNMLASVFGGNTCITEFEFLTGLTSGNFDTETNAFTQCVTRPVNSLAYELKAMDYKTVAIHPFWGNSWRRNKVYPLLGFDKSIFAEEFGTGIENSGSMRSKPRFGNFEYVRGYLSDVDCFKKVQQQFENKQEDERLFVFNVTIQNHGGYAYKGEDFKSDINVTGMDNPELEQYLTLAGKSDKALGDLIEYFKNYNEPTVVVIFGDHQPNIAFERVTRQEYGYLGKNARYVVPFVIWANYDIEEEYVKLTSPAYLSTMMKESCGIPLNKWDTVRSTLREQYPALTLRSAYNDNLIQTEVSLEESDIYNKYKILQYGMLFDEVKP